MVAPIPLRCTALVVHKLLTVTFMLLWIVPMEKEVFQGLSDVSEIARVETDVMDTLNQSGIAPDAKGMG